MHKAHVPFPLPIYLETDGESLSLPPSFYAINEMNLKTAEVEVNSLAGSFVFQLVVSRVTFAFYSR